MEDIIECLCNRPNREGDDYPSHHFKTSNLGVGMEHTCYIKDSKGSCGLDFYDNGKPCVWCCQILKRG